MMQSSSARVYGNVRGDAPAAMNSFFPSMMLPILFYRSELVAPCLDRRLSSSRRTAAIEAAVRQNPPIRAAYCLIGKKNSQRSATPSRHPTSLAAMRNIIAAVETLSRILSYEGTGVRHCEKFIALAVRQLVVQAKVARMRDPRLTRMRTTTATVPLYPVRWGNWRPSADD